MKLTKQLESEIIAVNNAYWDSYIKGDWQKTSSFLDENIKMIGSTAGEVYSNKKEVIEFLKNSARLVAGKIEMRDRQIEIIPAEPCVMVNEFLDLYILIKKQWVFYSKVRLSSLLKKTDKGWKYIQQHSSVPDANVMGNETTAFQKISKENQELKESVKRRTAELEQKNHELVIEAALERVRAQALGMKKAEDLLNVCEVLFRELQQLGFAELRNTMINIFDDHKGSFLNYDYSGHAGKTITNLSYNTHPVIEKQVKQARDSEDAFSEAVFTGKDLEDWKAFRRNAGEADDPRVEKIASLFYYFYSIGTGVIGISTYHSISGDKRNVLKRFRNVFDLAYRRFLDIEKAEVQAREAKIEAALERVRSRSMAMHKTKELAELIGTIFTELGKLDVILVRCLIAIYDYDTYDANWWMANSEALEKPINLYIKHIDIPANVAFNEKLREKPMKWVYIMEGDVKKEWDERMLTETELSTLPEEVKKGMRYPARSYVNASFNNYGCLSFVSLDPLSDVNFDIVIRFSKVFEQTYTRFLDLQKAESQAREAQIQLALERVRARTMAMQNSNELPQAANLLFQQIQSLGMPTWSAGYCIWDEDKNAITLWMSSEGVIQPSLRMPLTEDPSLMHFREAWEKGESFFVEEVGGEELKRHYAYLRTLPGVKETLNEIEKAGYPVPTFQIFHLAYFSYGFLLFITYESVPEAYDIFKRFGKVFDQTYTRFLDLQKAEAQAREAQIEAALERVRSRSMGMQKSDELKEVIKVVYDQFIHLNINIEHTGFVVDYTPKGDWHFWIADKNEIPSKITHPYFDSVWARQFNEAKEKGIDLFTTHLNFEEKNKFYQELLSYVPGLPEESKQFYLSCPGLAASTVLSDNVSLYIENFSGTPYTDEENKILKRFGKAFQQTYTRFLDLQKAEAQTREAKIEAALERTRTQSMLMQHSKELDDTLRVFHEQVLLLGINSEFSYLWLPDENRDRHIFWAAWAESLPTSQPGKNSSRVFKSKALNYPLDRNEPATAKCLVDWKSDEPVHSYYLPPGDEVENYFDNWKELLAGVERLKAKNFSGGIHYVEAFMKYGCFGVMIENELSEEEKKILYRFSIEFERTYTRFLDLQKAEAQAREAQIEAALEKVRSRTMAMQKSDELGDVATVLFKQLNSLVKDLWTCGFVLCEKDRAEDEWWLCTESGFIPAFYLPNVGDVTHYNIYQGWLNGEEYHTEQLEGEALHEHYDWLMSIPIAKKIFDDFATAGYERPKWQKLHCAYFSKGYLCIITQVPCPDENIFRRFASVFDLTYTRFLDLQKAEAQAREAQIEAALERVRSRTMAMHNSRELNETAELLYRELTKLGMEKLTCGFTLLEKQTTTGTCYMANPDGSFTWPPFRLDHSGSPVFDTMYKSWKKREPFNLSELSGKVNEEHNRYLAENADNFPMTAEQLLAILPPVTFSNTFNFRYGYLLVVSLSSLTKEQCDVLIRFARVFEQTYTRFLDLQKAEAQAREAQIEAALERVRSKAMAMQNSNDLNALISHLFDECTRLDLMLDRCIVTIVDPQTLNTTWVLSNPETPNEPSNHLVQYHDHHPYLAYLEAWKKRTEKWHYILEGEEKKTWDQFIFQQTELSKLPDPVKQGMQAISSIRLNNSFSNFGSLTLSSFETLTEPQWDILIRFTKVFDLTYTRFNDLKQAEAQAREAQIELSLERVRAKTMAMHSSEDVADTVATMLDELIKLGIETMRCGIGIMNDDSQMEAWTARSAEDGKTGLVIGRLDMTMHPLLQGAYNGWKNNEESFSYELKGDDLINYYTVINNHTDYPIKYDIASLPSEIYHNDFYFREGSLYVFSLHQLSAEASKIFKRFAAVFGQTYRRYLDLQRAEANAREAKVEAAMEKVRARAMAMQKPNELVEVAELLRKEMGLLGVEELETSSIYIHNENNGTTECWYAIQDIRDNEKKLAADYMTINLNDTWVGREMLKFYNSDQKQVSILMQGENRKEWINYCSEHSKLLKGYYGDVIPERTYHLLKFSNGYIGASSPGEISKESWDLLKRATAVFSLAYTRFSDLQIAEASAKEAVKQAALDRIRADIASMRTISDLDRITPLIWNELTILGIPFIRCGVFIMDEKQQLIHTFLSNPEGKAIAAFHLPYDTPGHLSKVLSHWKDHKIYIDHWDQSAFTEVADVLVKQGAIASPGQYLDSIPHGGFYLHFLPFLQGMLYVGNTTQLVEEDIELIQHVADAFSTAYARYEDFNKLETAKQQVEKTLVDLKQAQTQLVQSEKMASLGELTAGIAHEIQNPLNFVNNFSEVSNELLEEMKTELEKGNTHDALAIAEDVKQNLEKILHHGKRADGIVKGMLQHSRTSSGQKELTDINVLADEYLRLAYHGLRAKDKSFNAKFETHFDDAIDKINIIPQDIGRVILNLINNAFYAVSEKKKQNIADYEPTVTVSTSKIPPSGGGGAGNIEIRVKDNGIGIPQKVLDKIFQPFFTTKPTGQGTGLGLSLAYDIITKGHGGELKVETKEGEGSEFLVQLPA